MNETTNLFGTWLSDKLSERGWSPADLSRKSGISNSQISRILSGAVKPGAGVLGAIAKALMEPVDEALRYAGYLPLKRQEFEDLERRWENIFELAETEEEKKELIERARFELTRIRERRGDYKAD